jgi:hypothetical protein
VNEANKALLRRAANRYSAPTAVVWGLAGSAENMSVGLALETELCAAAHGDARRTVEECRDDLADWIWSLRRKFYKRGPSYGPVEREMS